MAYLQVTDFKYGMDRRRERVAGIPGTLWVCENAHITRGGDLERAKRFVPTYTLPTGTFGMAQVRGQLYAFGSADLSASMPLGVLYQRLQVSSANMTGVVWSAGFDGKLYVIAEFDDGGMYHFYNGSRVTAWDAVGANSANVTTLASFLADKISSSADVYASASGNVITVQARNAGVPFTVSVSAVNNGADNTQSITATTVRANVVGVEEVQATAAITVTGGTEGVYNYLTNLTADGVALTSTPVYFTSNVTTTAINLAAAINNLSSSHGYIAEAFGATVTLYAAPGQGASANGKLLNVTMSGDIAVTYTTVFGGGVSKVTPVAQVSKITLSGLFEAADLYSVTINSSGYSATGLASGTGTSVFVYSQRVWTTVESLTRYCKLNDPTDWTAVGDSGAGFINVANESEGAQRLVCATQYGTYVAIFTDKSIRLYELGAVPSNFTFQQQLDNTGTIAPRSVTTYGNSEVYYLDVTGIRSLRARDSLNIISVNDIGTAIDTYVQGIISSLDAKTVSRAVGVVEPKDGRYWLAIGPYVFVLSYFPSAKINAWSVYKPGFNITEFARVKDKIYARAGDVIYLYGGETGNEYPEDGEQPVVVETAFFDARDPAGAKDIPAFDVACSNEWDVRLLTDPNDEDKYVTVGKINKTTYSGPSVNVLSAGMQTHAAVRFTCNSGGRATISSFAIHFGKESAT